MYRRWLYGLAVLTAVMTFILICMGGLVTSTDSGLAVPDWPTTFGYNMFLYPLSKTVSGFLFSIDSNLQASLDDSNPSVELRTALENDENSVSEDVRITVIAPGSRWRLTDDENGRTYSVIKTGDRLDVYVHGVLYEHSHRLIGSVVGLLTIGLMVSILAKDNRNWMKWLGVVALAAVVLQGVMGGMRVTNLSRILAIIHACFAQAFFALTASLALFTSRGWLGASEQIEAANTSRLRNLTIITVCLIYVQFIFGAVLRHTGNRLDAHLLFAGLVTIHIFLLLRRILLDYLENRLLVRLILLLGGLLAVQLVLGFGAFVTEFTVLGKGVSPVAGVAITTAHVAIGALMMASSVLLALNVFRFTMGSEPVANRGLVSDEVSA
ncbi:MAG: COX15/CtaA family protein [Candidatus Poribacteria bacterium]|nr:COX15/CtaA family protein [Candidatus Poribacteria bacterium]